MKNFLILVLILIFSLAQAQKRYWVCFADKSDNYPPAYPFVSPQTLQNRQNLGLPAIQWTDFPVRVSYVDSITKLGAKIRVYSRWLNAVSAYLPDKELDKIKNLGFVVSVEPIHSFHVSCSKSDEPEFGTALTQMKGQAFFSAGVDGSGVTIGVIDAGFYKADKDPYLKHLFENQQILGFMDYVSPNKRDFFGVSNDNSTHGTTVLSNIAGRSKDYYKGLAPGAKFYLARTDDDDTEYRVEEDYWIAAMEWMDSLGVRLINTSLGYALGHTLPEEDYQPWQMDGKTTKITKAAQIAAKEKGLILINSAGNEGEEEKWRIIAAPADAQDVIAVGATNILGEKAGYSSIGPASLPYLKPDVSCFSLNGTSFSAPAVTGFVACLLQLKPNAKREEIVSVLQKSAHLYPYGNNFLGYGVPNAMKAINLIKSKPVESTAVVKNATGKKKYVINLKNKTLQRAILFHKENKTIVKTQTSTNQIKKGKLVIIRPENVAYTTVVAGEEVLEISW